MLVACLTFPGIALAQQSAPAPPPEHADAAAHEQAAHAEASMDDGQGAKSTTRCGLETRTGSHMARKRCRAAEQRKAEQQGGADFLDRVGRESKFGESKGR